MDRPYLSLLTLIGLFAPSDVTALGCSDIGPALQKLSYKHATPLQSSNFKGRSYASLFRECDDLGTYAGVQTRVSCRKDKNDVSGVWQFSEKTLVFTSKASVDADGSAYSRKAHWPNNPETSLKWDEPKEFLDAEAVSYIVLPQRDGKLGGFAIDAGIKRGDLAVIVSRDRCSVALVGDFGPYFRLGEISLKAQDDIGNPQCANKNEYPCTMLIGRGHEGISKDPPVTFMVFPRSRPAYLSLKTFEASKGLTLRRASDFLIQNHQ